VYADLAGDLPIPQTSDEAHRFIAHALSVALKNASSSAAARPSDQVRRHDTRGAFMDDLTADSAEAGDND
jgi:hypothetical protein